MKKEIYLAGGCFWGVQAYFQRIKGVLETSVHYLNGGFEGVSYREVCDSSSHVEAVRIIYDDVVLTPKNIFELFLNIINPYSLNKQGNDKGVQYRIGIYSRDLELRNEFQFLNDVFQKQQQRNNYIEIMDVYDDTRAEEYHQNYLLKNPNGYCHISLNDIPDKYLKN
ncbi:peptide-methionine (S)-S-oxide reductase [Mycoplasmopsis mustelae]|uniref:Peptide methionine sulfoxide reductase MsrA n=1 Tax=Mycoplasmopsis mustelae TaxID=171289 RepID=A0A4R7UEW2_9BACT|nr:peptide-methionine (S)-S-oxide reductase MsrA [Mycoplasmopsis mustelae]TDV24184.1 peptide-methionine (S)-S-oxide reductase [Mycoplasmopsis mustelae]